MWAENWRHLHGLYQNKGRSGWSERRTESGTYGRLVGDRVVFRLIVLRIHSLKEIQFFTISATLEVARLLINLGSIF
jgi:hypothetical protein